MRRSASVRVQCERRSFARARPSCRRCSSRSRTSEIGQSMDSQGKAKVALTFALYQGDQLVRRDTIAQDIVKVGKDPRSHLRVDDDLASRMHAVIEVASPADITLIDLGNEPGTLVNGQRVNKCKIRPNDQVQIGSTVIVLENAELAQGAGAAAPTPPPAPAV